MRLRLGHPPLLLVDQLFDAYKHTVPSQQSDQLLALPYSFTYPVAESDCRFSTFSSARTSAAVW